MKHKNIERFKCKGRAVINFLMNKLKYLKKLEKRWQALIVLSIFCVILLIIGAFKMIPLYLTFGFIFIVSIYAIYLSLDKEHDLQQFIITPIFLSYSILSLTFTITDFFASVNGIYFFEIYISIYSFITLVFYIFSISFYNYKNKILGNDDPSIFYFISDMVKNSMVVFTIMASGLSYIKTMHDYFYIIIAIFLPFVVLTSIYIYELFSINNIYRKNK